MARLNKSTRLYEVRHSEHFISSHIEASSAQEAIAIATEKLDDKKVIEVTSEPIYEDSIGVEDDSPDENVSNTAVTEIIIRGTDPARVDALKRALGYLIAGPHHGDEEEFNPDLIDNPKMLMAELAKLDVTSY